MESTDYEGGTGGKLRRQPLRRVSSTPYEQASPPLDLSGSHGSQPKTEAGGSRWFSKLVDPASRVIVRSASRLLSVFGEDLTAPPGEHIDTIGGVLEMNNLQKSSLEVREQRESPTDVRLSIVYDGSDKSEQELISHSDASFSELEQLLKKRRFSRVEIDRLSELLHSRTIEPSTLPSTEYKNKGKINDDSSINSSSSQQAVSHEEMEEEKEKKNANTSRLEGQMGQLANLHGNDTYAVHANFSAGDSDAPIEIARAYMGSMLRKAAPSTLGLQSQIYKVSPLNLQFGNKPSIAAIASRSAASFPVIPTDSGNDCMAQKPRGKSALYKISRPHCRSFKMTNTREYSPYKDSNVEPTMSLEWTPSVSNIRQPAHGQALKRGSFDDARRVHQMSSMKDSNMSTHLGTSTFFIGQEYKYDIDLKGPGNLDAKMPSHFLHVPSQSTVMAGKILHQLDKLSPSPQSKLSKKKVIAGDASFSKLSLSASHEGSLKFKDNNGSTKLLDVQGRRNLGELSSSNLAIITSSSSPTKDKVGGEVSLMPYTSGAEVAPCLGINSSDTSASVANHSMKSMDSNNHGLALIPWRKEPAVQSALDDKVGSVKAEHVAILASVKEPMEKSFEHSFEYVHTSGLMHTNSDTKAFDKAFTERNASFNLLAAHTYNTLSKPLSSHTMATTLAADATPKMENSVSPLLSGSKVSTYNATKPISRGGGERLNAGSLSVVSSSTGNEAPKFHFGRGNSTSYSFTGVSAISLSTDSGSLSTFAVFPISANGAFGVSSTSTSGGSNLQFGNCSYQNTAIKFGAGTTSSCGTWGISSGDGVNNFSRKPVFQFGTLDSYAKSGVGSS
ncbi:nuclear pore complex protein NUP1-like [Phalaenopsis equestris]|uniref:nuclear pore complex protein NUP1-like n=1 Tax=Phalaenopsis equestris TaxID=78828 RepID=UPI0009E65CC9|nr:nuclear pore complex protein NUP1-like [Phalaenopsis equestris]